MAIDELYIPPQREREQLIKSRMFLEACAFMQKHVKILELMASGKITKEIAAAVGKSYRTIEGTITKMKDKTGAKSLAHLMAIAYQWQILKIE